MTLDGISVEDIDESAMYIHIHPSRLTTQKQLAAAYA